jgi:hypothetical protein
VSSLTHDKAAADSWPVFGTLKTVPDTFFNTVKGKKEETMKNLLFLIGAALLLGLTAGCIEETAQPTDKKQPDKKQPDKKQPDKKQPDKKQPDKKQPDKKQPDKKDKPAAGLSPWSSDRSDLCLLTAESANGSVSAPPEAKPVAVIVPIFGRMLPELGTFVSVEKTGSFISSVVESVRS